MSAIIDAQQGRRQFSSKLLPVNAYSDLISWIGVTDLEHLDHSRGMAMVKAALEYLESLKSASSSEIESALRPIYEDFLTGGLPVDRLRVFCERYSEAIQQDPPGLILEEEFRQLAEDLPEEEWCTGSYLKLEAGIEAFLDGETEPLEDAIFDMEDVLEQAWEPYSQSPVADCEVTAETVLGHQLLLEGIKEWKQALELARAAANSEAEWDDALEAAQYGNRILVALQKFSTRIQNTI